MSVWDLLQNRLFDSVVLSLESVGWDVGTLGVADRELIALWRAETTITCTGFLSYLGKWGLGCCCIAITALEDIGAPIRAEVLRSMLNIAGPHLNRVGVESYIDILLSLSETDRLRLRRLDEAFGLCSEPLARLIVEHYGAAKFAH
ncbi:DMP19 family protein [Mycetocola saprophilus]|uniref:DMP19 family protein n=1 Tax=Mycetocola saprophilus TaxID=76636 RepID=UPI003BEF7A6A